MERGFDVRLETKQKEVKETLLNWRPHFCVANMMLADYTGLGLLEYVTEKKLDTKVFITSSHNDIENVKTALRAGAKDYIVKPYKVEDILSRLIFQIQKKRKIPSETEKPQEKDEALLIQLVNFVLKEANTKKSLHSILFNHSKMLEIALKAVRCSLIHCDPDRQTGFVVCSSDERSLRGLQIDLNRYPEVIHVMNTEKMVVIENMENDPTMAAIKEVVKSISFNAIIVSPVFKRGEFYGVVSARMPKEKGDFQDKDIRFAQIVSQVMSLVVSMDLQQELKFEKKEKKQEPQVEAPQESTSSSKKEEKAS
tara:strand:+ start:34389 stop:35318 length:930 start_codon:yes stop_codon:yes gene_type:complete